MSAEHDGTQTHLVNGCHTTQSTMEWELDVRGWSTLAIPVDQEREETRSELWKRYIQTVTSKYFL